MTEHLSINTGMNTESTTEMSLRLARQDKELREKKKLELVFQLGTIRDDLTKLARVKKDVRKMQKDIGDLEIDMVEVKDTLVRNTHYVKKLCEQIDRRDHTKEYSGWRRAAVFAIVPFITGGLGFFIAAYYAGRIT